MIVAQNDKIKELDDILAPHRQDLDVLGQALKEINEEEGEVRKKAAKDLVKQALDLKKQFIQTERNFNGEKKKFEKALGKLLGRINAMAKGEAPPEDEDDKDKKDD